VIPSATTLAGTQPGQPYSFANPRLAAYPRTVAAKPSYTQGEPLPSKKAAAAAAAAAKKKKQAESSSSSSSSSSSGDEVEVPVVVERRSPEVRGGSLDLLGGGAGPGIGLPAGTVAATAMMFGGMGRGGFGTGGGLVGGGGRGGGGNNARRKGRR
jgi:hypothetical protein